VGVLRRLRHDLSPRVQLSSTPGGRPGIPRLTRTAPAGRATSRALRRCHRSGRRRVRAPHAAKRSRSRSP
jgi:hypothetical protein